VTDCVHFSEPGHIPSHSLAIGQIWLLPLSAQITPQTSIVVLLPLPLPEPLPLPLEIVAWIKHPAKPGPLYPVAQLVSLFPVHCFVHHALASPWNSMHM
jgi:hypothetical protein